MNDFELNIYSMKNAGIINLKTLLNNLDDEFSNDEKISIIIFFCKKIAFNIKNQVDVEGTSLKIFHQDLNLSNIVIDLDSSDNIIVNFIDYGFGFLGVDNIFNPGFLLPKHPPESLYFTSHYKLDMTFEEQSKNYEKFINDTSFNNVSVNVNIRNKHNYLKRKNIKYSDFEQIKNYGYDFYYFFNFILNSYGDIKNSSGIKLKNLKEEFLKITDKDVRNRIYNINKIIDIFNSFQIEEPLDKIILKVKSYIDTKKFYGEGGFGCTFNYNYNNFNNYLDNLKWTNLYEDSQPKFDEVLKLEMKLDNFFCKLPSMSSPMLDESYIEELSDNYDGLYSSLYMDISDMAAGGNQLKRRIYNCNSNINKEYSFTFIPNINNLINSYLFSDYSFYNDFIKNTHLMTKPDFMIIPHKVSILKNKSIDIFLKKITNIFGIEKCCKIKYLFFYYQIYKQNNEDNNITYSLNNFSTEFNLKDHFDNLYYKSLEYYIKEKNPSIYYISINTIITEKIKILKNLCFEEDDLDEVDRIPKIIHSIWINSRYDFSSNNINRYIQITKTWDSAFDSNPVYHLWLTLPIDTINGKSIIPNSIKKWQNEFGDRLIVHNLNSEIEIDNLFSSDITKKHLWEQIPYFISKVDWVRYSILVKYGGIIRDFTDSFCFKSIEFLRRKCKFIIPYLHNSQNYIGTNFIYQLDSPITAATKNHPLAKYHELKMVFKLRDVQLGISIKQQQNITSDTVRPDTKNLFYNINYKDKENMLVFNQFAVATIHGPFSITCAFLDYLNEKKKIFNSIDMNLRKFNENARCGDKMYFSNLIDVEENDRVLIIPPELSLVEHLPNIKFSNCIIYQEEDKLFIFIKLDEILKYYKNKLKYKVGKVINYKNLLGEPINYDDFEIKLELLNINDDIHYLHSKNYEKVKFSISTCEIEFQSDSDSYFGHFETRTWT